MVNIIKVKFFSTNSIKIFKILGEQKMEKWRKIGTYFDMIVEERGKNRRLIDWTGKIITEFRLD